MAKSTSDAAPELQGRRKDASISDASKVMRGRASDSYQRWEPPAVDGARITQAGGFARVPTASELEALERVAYQDGFRRGHEDGFERGRREGFAAGQAQARELAECLRAVLSQFEDPLEKFDETVEQALVQLAMAVARQLVHLELTVNPELVVAVVREGLHALPLTARGVRVYLEPVDAALVRVALGASPGQPGYQLIEDPALKRGDCRIESDSSRIDADVESRLAVVIAQVLGGERSGEPVAGP